MAFNFGKWIKGTAIGTVAIGVGGYVIGFVGDLAGMHAWLMNPLALNGDMLPVVFSLFLAVAAAEFIQVKFLSKL